MWRLPGLDLRIAGFSRSDIPFDMFDVALEAAAARRSAKLERIYHKGQDLAWDGKKVLAELIEKHGGVTLATDKGVSLGRIFAVLMWGELAAWKISCQLADRLETLEAKMAATSQAHDEARHFYVLYDYLSELGQVPRDIDRPSRAVIDLVLNTDSLMEKLIGMQLMLETLALTIFQLVREAKVEPVITELLRFYERDEARHVGLGVQHLPALMKRASALEHGKAIVFQLKMTAWTLRGLQVLEPHFNAIGVDTRRVISVGRNKMFTASEMLWSGMGMRRPPARDKLEAAIDSLMEVLFPRPEVGPSWMRRLSAARRVWKAGGFDSHIVDLAGS